MQIWTVLIRPREFFGHLKGQPRNLLGPGLTVAIAQLLTSGASVVWVRNLPIAPSPFNAVWMPIALSLIGGLIVWGLYGLLVRLLAGAMARPWELTGWLALPGCIAGLLLLILAAVMPVKTSLGPAPDISNLEAFQAWSEAYQTLLSQQLYPTIAIGISLVVHLWGLWILYSGLKALSPQRAALPVVVVVAIAIAFVATSIMWQMA